MAATAVAFDAAFGGMPPDVDVESVVARGEARSVLVQVSGRDDDLLANWPLAAAYTGRQSDVDDHRIGSGAGQRR